MPEQRLLRHWKGRAELPLRTQGSQFQPMDLGCFTYTAWCVCPSRDSHTDTTGGTRTSANQGERQEATQAPETQEPCTNFRRRANTAYFSVVVEIRRGC
jgi:hypothetical protein